MDKNFLAKQRNALKSRLARRRIILHAGKFQPECAICNLAITTAPDMHEAFLTRGDLQNSDHFVKVDAINGSNCVLVHPGGNNSPCHAMAATKKGQRIVVRHLIRWEGYVPCKRWLAKMNKWMKGTQAQQGLRLLEEVHREGEM